MLAVPADRLPAALADLDPGNRALLDLSLRRGVSDAEIGELLRKDPDAVARGRDAVLELLADVLGVDAHDRRERVRRAIVELPDEAWRAPAQPEPAPEPLSPRNGSESDAASAPEPPAEAEQEPEAETAVTEAPREHPEPSRKEPEPPAPLRDRMPFEQSDAPPRRTGRLLALVGVLIVAAVLAVILIGGGDDKSDEPASNAQPDKAEPAPSPGGKARRVKLGAVGRGKATGRFSVRGDRRATLSVRGLPNPAGSYQVWLYNNLVDSVPLGTLRGGSGKVQIRLPADARRYRYLDISHEPADGNPNHSGDSVLRARVKNLLRG